MQQFIFLTFELALAGVAGGLLGMGFFVGLWWTLRRALASPRPALWVGCSLLLRSVFVAIGFIVVSSSDWQRLLACLLGFWAARWFVVSHFTLRTKQSQDAPTAVGKMGSGQSTTNSP
jgi:F1F0 ATPase subunit 2